jgi:predicted AAA+ superfamily ATPase
VHQYHLFPLILAERKGSEQSTIMDMADSEPLRPGFPMHDIETILIYGNLPGITLEEEMTRKATLESYAEIYIEEEIRREALVRNIGPFSRFLELAALESGQVMNLSGLSQQSGVPVATIRSFYQVLVDAFVGFWLEPFAGRTRKRLLTTPMFYFFDTGVRNALARVPLPDRACTCRPEPCFSNGRQRSSGTAAGIWAVTTGCISGIRFQEPKLIL